MEGIQILGLVLFGAMILYMVVSIGKTEKEEEVGEEEIKGTFLIKSAEVEDYYITYELEDAKKRIFFVELEQPYTVGTSISLELVVLSMNCYTSYWGMNKKYQLDDSGEKLVTYEVYEKDSDLEDDEEE